jgi:hypothetical protein
VQIEEELNVVPANPLAIICGSMWIWFLSVCNVTYTAWNAVVFSSCATCMGGKVNYPCSQPWRPIGLWNVEAPTFSRQSAHRWRYVLVTHYPQENSWCLFLLEAE